MQRPQNKVSPITDAMPTASTTAIPGAIPGAIHAAIADFEQDKLAVEFADLAVTIVLEERDDVPVLGSLASVRVKPATARRSPRSEN